MSRVGQPDMSGLGGAPKVPATPQAQPSENIESTEEAKPLDSRELENIADMLKELNELRAQTWSAQGHTGSIWERDIKSTEKMRQRLGVLETATKAKETDEAAK